MTFIVFSVSILFIFLTVGALIISPSVFFVVVIVVGLLNVEHTSRCVIAKVMPTVMDNIFMQ